MICTILKRHGIEPINLHPFLAESGDEYLDTSMEDWTKGRTNYFMPTVPMQRLSGKLYMERATILNKNNIPGGMSALAQVCALLGHQPTRYENLISAFATGHIKGLRAAGATEEEVKQIALRDRLVRGGSLNDESIAASILAGVRPLDSGASYLTYAFYSANQNDPIFDPKIQQSLLDYVIIQGRKSCTVTLIFNRHDQQGNITALKAYASTKYHIELTISRAQGYSYTTSLTRDKRTGMHCVNFYIRDDSTPVTSFADYFGNTGRAKTAPDCPRPNPQP